MMMTMMMTMIDQMQQSCGKWKKDNDQQMNGSKTIYGKIKAMFQTTFLRNRSSKNDIPVVYCHQHSLNIMKPSAWPPQFRPEEHQAQEQHTPRTSHGLKDRGFFSARKHGEYQADMASKPANIRDLRIQKGYCNGYMICIYIYECGHIIRDRLKFVGIYGNIWWEYIVWKWVRIHQRMIWSIQDTPRTFLMGKNSRASCTPW